MTTTVIVKTGERHAVEVSHIEHSQGHELSRRVETIPKNSERLMHVWQGRDIRVTELPDEEIDEAK